MEYHLLLEIRFHTELPLFNRVPGHSLSIHEMKNVGWLHSKVEVRALCHGSPQPIVASWGVPQSRGA
jgi:hypothetical protein